MRAFARVIRSGALSFCGDAFGERRPLEDTREPFGEILKELVSYIISKKLAIYCVRLLRGAGAASR